MTRTKHFVSIALFTIAILITQISVAAQSATFSRSDYPLLGNNHIVADLNGDGIPDIGLPIIGANPGLAVLLNSTGAAAVQPALGTLTATPSTVAGGGVSQIRISLSAGVAPSGGFSFAVSGSNTAVLSVPSSVVMSGGSSSVTFNATARNVSSTQSAIVSIRNVQLGRRDVTVSVTPAASTPPPLTVSTLALSATSVTGGNAIQGTIRLSATAPAATLVSLGSNNAAATVPASVTVAAGASSATFTINTIAVTASATATISASLNGVTRTASLTINPAGTPPPASDTVRITRAEYDSGKRTLRVEATSTRDATLQVFNTATGQLLGTLGNSGGGQYRAEVSTATNPQNITVRSNLGGVATRAVDAR